MKRRASLIALVAALFALAAAFVAGAAGAQSAVVKPVIGPAKTVPAIPVAGQRFTVSFSVTRSDTGGPLLRGRMICDPSVSGKVIQHAEAFKAGTARLSFVIPNAAQGKLLRVKVTIKLGVASATKVVNFKVGKQATTQGLPNISIGDSTVVEGNSGTTTLSFAVTLAAASTQTVSVDYATANGTATAGSDYTAASGTLTFKPGETAKTIDVSVIGDTLVEPDETLTVTLSNPRNAALADPAATGTITNDDVAAPKSGHYAGTYSDGTYFNFDVGVTGRTIGNFAFDFNGHCPGYGTSYGSLTIPGAIALPTNGVFSLTAKTSSGNLAVSLGGTVATDGTATGSLRVDMYFSDGVTCTSSGTWSARVQ